MRALTRTVLAILLTSATIALGQTTPAPSAAPLSSTEARAKVAETISTYRLEYNIYEIEGGKRIGTRSYTMRLTDYNMTTTMKTGSRVPISTATLGGGNTSSLGTQFQYVDVGVSIDAKLRMLEGRLFLATGIEMSGIAPDQAGQGPNPIIRSNNAQSNTTVTLGKNMLLASIDDSILKRRYEVEVKVTQE